MWGGPNTASLQSAQGQEEGLGHFDASRAGGSDRLVLPPSIRLDSPTIC